MNMTVQTQLINRPPYFVDLLKDKPNDEKLSQFNDRDFRIVDLTITESVNGGSRALISMQMISNQKSYLTDKAGAIDDFVKAQLFKHVALCAEYRVSAATDTFKKTYFHGFLQNYTITFGFPYDVITLEVCTYFELLKLQNHYRTFENKNVKDILTSVFEYYADSNAGGVVGGRFKYDFSSIIPDMHTSTRVQVLQVGESDYDFVSRLLKEDNLSFFFYHTEETSIFVVTPDLLDTLKHYESEKKPEFTFSDSLKYTLYPLQTNPVAYTTQMNMPKYTNDTQSFWNFTNFRRQSSSIGTEIQTLDYNVSDDYRFVQQANGGELNAKLKKQKEEHTSDDAPVFPFRLEWKKYVSSSANSPERDSQKIVDHIDNQMIKDLARRAFLNYVSSGDCKTIAFVPLLRKLALWLDTGKDNLRAPLLSVTDNTLHGIVYHTTLKYRTAAVPVQMKSPSASSMMAPTMMHYFEASLKFFDANIKKESVMIPFQFDELDLHKSNNHRPLGAFHAIVMPFTDQDKKQMESKAAQAKILVPNMIRIRFPWQKPDQSTLARMSFGWTGNAYGSMFLPEVGSEVIVSFVSHNYDYPVILGCLYNADNVYPELPKLHELDLASGVGVRGIQFAAGDAGEYVGMTPFHPDDPSKNIRTLFMRSSELFKTTALGSYARDVKSLSQIRVLEKDGSYKVSVGDEKSDSNIEMTTDKIGMNSSSNSLAITKDGSIDLKSDAKISMASKNTITSESSEIAIKAKQKIQLDGNSSSITIAPGKIDANSLQILK